MFPHPLFGMRGAHFMSQQVETRSRLIDGSVGFEASDEYEVPATAAQYPLAVRIECELIVLVVNVTEC